MDAQLVDLYAERDAERDAERGNDTSREALAAMVEQLDAQVRTLVGEKADLERRLAACTCTPR